VVDAEVELQVGGGELLGGEGRGGGH
jgi:hypothetical protein